MEINCFLEFVFCVVDIRQKRNSFDTKINSDLLVMTRFIQNVKLFCVDVIGEYIAIIFIR